MAETSTDEEIQAVDSDEAASGDDAKPALDPEQEARRAYALAQVRQYPDTALRMQAREVTEFDEPLATLAERMTTIMRDARGVGLAAPQVGVLQRVIVFQASPEVEPAALVNPVVVDKSSETAVGEEGCLSLGRATINMDIERSTSIKVEAVTPSGEPIVVEAEAFEARVIQHELDHLEGILIIDHASAEDRRDAMAKLRPQPGTNG